MPLIVRKRKGQTKGDDKSYEYNISMDEETPSSDHKPLLKNTTYYSTDRIRSSLLTTSTATETTTTCMHCFKIFVILFLCFLLSITFISFIQNTSINNNDTSSTIRRSNHQQQQQQHKNYASLSTTSSSASYEYLKEVYKNFDVPLVTDEMTWKHKKMLKTGFTTSPFTSTSTRTRTTTTHRDNGIFTSSSSSSSSSSNHISSDNNNNNNNNNNTTIDTPTSSSIISYYPIFDIQDMVHPFDEQIDFNEKLKSFLLSSSSSSSSSSSTSSKNKIIQEIKKKKYYDINKRVILTRRGYKGGLLQDQVNQDRAIIIDSILPSLSTQLLSSSSSSSPSSSSSLIGIFDGHASNGHFVSNFVQQYLPIVLEKYLVKTIEVEHHQQQQRNNNNNNMTTTTRKREGPGKESMLFNTSELIQHVLKETFHIVDDKVPADYAYGAGCTTSILLQIGSTVYSANVGDSQSFIVSYIKSSNKVDIIYKTNKHKPDDPEERRRIESMGGYVDIPLLKEQEINGQIIDVSSRVIIPQIGSTPFALAMSRTIGDRDGRVVGVIAEPAIDVVSLSSFLNDNKNGYNDVEFFAVAASDGLLDFIEPIDVAHRLARSLYELDQPGTPTLVEACQDLIVEASQAWLNLASRYRDDITIAVNKIKL